LAAGDDDAAARAAQGLVGGRGDDVGVRHRVRVHARGHQAGDVVPVDGQVRADHAGDGGEARPVDISRIGGEAAHQTPRLVFHGQALDLVVVDQAPLVDAVLHRVEQLAAGVDLGAVGEVAAVGQAHAEDGVAGIEQGEIDGLVGLRTGVRLDIG